ncbi:MAG: hypothetical protein M1834_006953 [Cirrosporium novae-zelandiae]|nr:MAG: hypothetical protein M1834_006953 [Cirrosporium novae-zelandiae]
MDLRDELTTLSWDDVNDCATDDPRPETSYYEADSDEEVVGVPNIAAQTAWGGEAAELIASPAGMGGGWVGDKPLGRGGFGLVALWVKRDENGHVTDRLVIKQISAKQGRWNPDIPKEVKAMHHMAGFKCKNLVKMLSYRRYSRHKVHRIYYEYCPYKDMLVLDAQYERWRSYLPEPFLWEAFGGLIDAIECLRKGSTKPGHIKKGVPEWSWAHRDIKPGNVFLGEVPEVEEGPRYRTGQYPEAKLGDYGLAVQVNSQQPVRINPDSIRGDGTLGWLAPEQLGDDNNYEEWAGLLGPRSRRLDSHTNVWAIGAVMYTMMTHYALPDWYADPPDEENPNINEFCIEEIRTRREPEYSERLRTVIRECLRWDSDRRPTVQSLIDYIKFYHEKVFNREVAEEDVLFFRNNDINDMPPGLFAPPHDPGNSLVRGGQFRDPDIGSFRPPHFQQYGEIYGRDPTGVSFGPPLIPPPPPERSNPTLPLMGYATYNSYIMKQRNDEDENTEMTEDPSGQLEEEEEEEEEQRQEPREEVPWKTRELEKERQKLIRVGNKIRAFRGRWHVAVARVREATGAHEMRNESIPQDVVDEARHLQLDGRRLDEAEAGYQQDLDEWRADGGVNLYSDPAGAADNAVAGPAYPPPPPQQQQQQQQPAQHQNPLWQAAALGDLPAQEPQQPVTRILAQPHGQSPITAIRPPQQPPTHHYGLRKRKAIDYREEELSWGVGGGEIGDGDGGPERKKRRRKEDITYDPDDAMDLG